ncbi:MAG TPA: peptidylprolyl isomerase [Methylophilaceae bacterium]|nr:peptidylprolyl isomerase [Methylophilaceae bacterium]
MTKRILVALALTGLLAPAVHAADPATVNGKPIKQSLVDFVLKDAAAQGQKIDDQSKSLVLNRLVTQEVVIQEAQKAGLDKQADYLARQELANRELLINTYLQDFIKKNPISEADIKAEYDKFKQQLGDKEYNARHILVKTEQEAKDIIAQLAKGADFAKLAREKSQDPGSKDKGGELDWFSPARMVKPFSDAVVGMKKGEYTKTPVQTQYGWHVIKLVDVRNTQPPAYEKVKDGIQKELQQRQIEKMVSDLRAKAKIVDNSSTK